MTENQITEWKETWNDDYLAWICGFANAQGGKICIGIDDKGHVNGLKNARRLTEDLPNKIRDTLGIIADINLWQPPKTLLRRFAANFVAIRSQKT